MPEQAGKARMLLHTRNAALTARAGQRRFTDMPLLVREIQAGDLADVRAGRIDVASPLPAAETRRSCSYAG